MDRDEKEMNREIYSALISRSRIAFLCPASSYIVFRTDFRAGRCMRGHMRGQHPASLTRAILSFIAHEMNIRLVTLSHVTRRVK